LKCFSCHDSAINYVTLHKLITSENWVPVTTAWRVLRLRMEKRLPDMECSCEYIKWAVADSRQGVVLQFEGWARCWKVLTVKS
jgi:hypothetical protein